MSARWYCKAVATPTRRCPIPSPNRRISPPRPRGCTSLTFRIHTHSFRRGQLPTRTRRRSASCPKGAEHASFESPSSRATRWTSPWTGTIRTARTPPPEAPRNPPSPAHRFPWSAWRTRSAPEGIGNLVLSRLRSACAGDLPSSKHSALRVLVPAKPLTIPFEQPEASTRPPWVRDSADAQVHPGRPTDRTM